MRAHRELQKSMDDIWINLALTYMRVCVVNDGAEQAEELDKVLASFRDVKASGAPLYGFTVDIRSSLLHSVKSQSLSCAGPE